MATHVLGGGQAHDGSDHCSEREPGDWNWCLACALVMLARAAGIKAPSSVGEAAALAHQAGYHGDAGTNLTRLGPAFKDRYGVAFNRSTDPNPENVLTPGRAAAVVGSMSAFGQHHPLRRHQPSFDGIHGVLVARLANGNFLWDDPLAAEGGYAGDIVSEEEVQAYYNAAGGGIREMGWLASGSANPLIAQGMIPAEGRKPVNELDLSNNLYYGRGVLMKGNQPILDAPHGRKVATSTAGQVLHYIGSTPTHRCVAFKDQPRYVAYAAGTIVPIVPPHAEDGSLPAVPHP